MLDTAVFSSERSYRTVIQNGPELPTRTPGTPAAPVSCEQSRSAALTELFQLTKRAEIAAKQKGHISAAKKSPFLHLSPLLP